MERFDPDGWTARLLREHDRKHAFAGDVDDFAAWQAAFREDLRGVLGHRVIGERPIPDLDPRRRGTETADGHERQEWVVRTERGLDLPFYLLVPDDAEPPYPAVVTVHGHTHLGKELYAGLDEEGEEIEEEARDVARQAVRRGYAAIAPDMRGFGELSYPEDRRAGRKSCPRMQMGAQLFGRSLVGDRVWDVTRALDFVEDRPALDGDRIALTGNSGGGTVTLFGAAVDGRVDVAVPASYFCTFEDSIVAMEHCECNYVPGVLGLGEMWDVAGLVAPRPFRALHGREDDIFPVEGTRRAFDRLEDIYGAAGAPGNCDLYVGDGGHRYYPEGAWPFVAEHL